MGRQVIYEILNIEKNKRYIGSAVDYNRRVKRHINLLNKNKHHSIKLQNAFNKYGEISFIFNVLEYVLDKDILIEREQFWMDKLKPEYNMTLIAGLNSHLGIKRSEETKKKISEALTGKKQSAEHVEANRKGHLGLKQNEITKQKRVDSLKNSEKAKLSYQCEKRKEKTKQTRIKNGGYVVTEDMKKKISETLKKNKNASKLVEKCSLDGELIKTYNSMYEAELENNLSKKSLSAMFKRNENNIGVFKGYIWKLKNKIYEDKK